LGFFWGTASGQLPFGVLRKAVLTWRFVMIEVTKINGVKVLINPDLIELVEETPDTVVSFTTGRKIIIKESRQDIKELVKSYRKDIFA
jgi:flagellar protein FlbD